jgi:hypothetical protein
LNAYFQTIRCYCNKLPWFDPKIPICLGIQQLVDRLLHGSADHLRKVLLDLLFVDLDDFATVFRYTVGHAALLPWLNG